MNERVMENEMEDLEYQDSEPPCRCGGLFVIFRKEIADHIHSRPFLLVLALIGLTSIASIYGAVSGLGQEAGAGERGMNALFLRLFTSDSGSVPSFMSLMALFGPFVGLVLGFDAINREEAEGTLTRLAAQLVYRASIINGKFLAGAALIGILVFSMGLFTGATGLFITGISPTGEELGKISVFLLFTCIYICFWLALSILLSVICRHTATSAMLGIGCWIFFILFMSMIVRVLVDILYPQDQMVTVGDLMDRSSLNLGLNRLSPYYLYSEAVSTIMNPSAWSTNIILPFQMEGAAAGFLFLGQSLLLVWPHLMGLLAGGTVVFAVSYVWFMKREIHGRQNRKEMGAASFSRFERRNVDKDSVV